MQTRALCGDEIVRDGIEACFAYEGPLATALWRLKYRGDAALAGPLGAAMRHAAVWRREWDALVTVPLHWRRRLARGHDHARLIAASALREIPRAPPLRSRWLFRTRATPSQAGRPAAERPANVAHAFAVRDPSRVAGRRILLLDDVTTTGATLSACRAALLAARAFEVGALALMRTLT